MVPCQLNFPFPQLLSFSSSLLSSSSFFSWLTDSSSSSLFPVKWSSSWCPKRRRMRSQEWGWMWTHGPCSSVSGRIPGTEWPVVFDFQPSSQTRVISLKSWKLWKPQRERKSWHLKNREHFSGMTVLSCSDAIWLLVVPNQARDQPRDKVTYWAVLDS